MCMAFPGMVLEVNKDTALVDFLGQKRDANCSLVKCKPGEYVIVNAGFIVEIVPEKEAKESIGLWKNAT